jgi:amino acid transporter
VFTPSVLTILGLILFLRLGFVVGQAGLARALIVIGIANAISVLTSISLAAIATNMPVKGGGDYYLISRTLGLEFGGAIGVLLFLAQSVSVGFYCIGLGEAMSALTAGPWWASTRVWAGGAVAALLIVAWFGASAATRFQYAVMAALGLALCSFFAGGAMRWDTGLLLDSWGNPGLGLDFWTVFAVFFPAVTGFTQGVSMSGDLKDPGRSLPLGTFAAVGVSIFVYVAAALVFAATLPLDVLRGEYDAMQRVALFGPLVSAGVIAATLSSAMASFMGAPRILQALASDRIFPPLALFGHGTGPEQNPRRGLLLTGAIAAGMVGLGRLNLIAPLVSMFFLISYGLLNYATFYEARTASPSFRPRFRLYDARLSLLGALACIGAVLAVNVFAGIAAVSLIAAIFQYLRRTAPPVAWADSRRSYHLQQIRHHLLAASRETEHPSHWRPQILAFTEDLRSREQLLRFAEWIEGGSGLTTVVRIVEGEGMKGLKLRSQAWKELVQSVQEAGTGAFPLVAAAPDLPTGISLVLQSYGVGPLQANTVLLNWFREERPGSGNRAETVRNLRLVFRLGYNIVMLDARQGKWTPPEGKGSRIDIWWQGGATSRLMLLLAHLVTRHELWQRAELRVLALARSEHRQEVESRLQEILANYRIEAQTAIVDRHHPHAVVERSRDADLVFLPFTMRGDDLLGPFEGDLEWLLVRLPATALVFAAEDIELDAEPEQGVQADRAQIAQRVEEAEKRVRLAEKEAEQAAETVEKRRNALEQSRAAGGEPEALRELASELHEAREAFQQASRKLAKARAKKQEAARELETFDAEAAKESKEPRSG